MPKRKIKLSCSGCGGYAWYLYALPEGGYSPICANLENNGIDEHNLMCIENHNPEEKALDETKKRINK